MQVPKNIVFVDFDDEQQPFTLGVRRGGRRSPHIQFYDVFALEDSFILAAANSCSVGHPVYPNYARYWAKKGLRIIHAAEGSSYTRLARRPDLTDFFARARFGERPAVAQSSRRGGE